MKINPNGTPNCTVLDVTDKTVRLVSLTPGLFKITFVVEKPEVLAAFVPQAQVAVSFDVGLPPPPPDDGLSLDLSQLVSLPPGMNTQPQGATSPLPTSGSSNATSAATSLTPPGTITPPPPPATATPGFPVAKIDQIHDLLGVGAGVAYYNEGDPINATGVITKRDSW